MKKRIWRILFIFFDWISAFSSWFLFYYFRKTWIENTEFDIDNSFFIGIIVVPLAWLLLYYLQGTYIEIKRMYRLRAISFTISATIIGSLIIFFILLLDDDVKEYTTYYQSVSLLFLLHFSCTVAVRFIITSLIVQDAIKPNKGFNTLLVGGSEKALKLHNELSSMPKSVYNFIGFINLNGIDKVLSEKLPHLGQLDKIQWIIREKQVEELIIALDSSEHNKLKKIISKTQGANLKVKILPDMYDILSGSVRMTSIFGALLLEINQQSMSIWQQASKRFLDITVSIIAILFCIPLFLVIAIAIKLSSKGSVLFFQNRVGLGGKEFKIIKFRTMHVDSEAKGPQLSSENDPRITKIGRFLRKTRLDEFPQFFNVITGDMSLVGPRPERLFYMNQISKIEPQFLHLTNIRPGITSWGQVKFGYAENIDEMLMRMKYDLLYMKNRSLALDFKILFYTALTIIKAKGK